MNDLDGILRELGQFGNYQILVFTLLLFPFVFFSSATLTYVFTTVDGDYRCFIPECDENGTSTQTPPWLRDAMPARDGLPENLCLRYAPALNSSDTNATCSSESFSNLTEECDTFVLGSDKNTITKEFGLFCDKNNWKRTLVGTVNQVGLFCGMVFSGIISDRFGRKTVVLWSLASASVLGILRSLSTSYEMYVSLEFLDAVFHSGVFNTVYVIAVELVGPEWRSLGGTVVSIYYALGEILLGLLVILCDDWRKYLRAVYVPMLIISVLYVWILPESIRWMVSRRKKAKVTEAIKSIAAWNNKPFTDEIQKTIEYLCLNEVENMPDMWRKSNFPLKEVLKSRKLMFYVLCCSMCWITNMFVYFGLSVYSVVLQGNKYWNFILTSLIEIPAYVLSFVLMNSLGRKFSLSLGLAVSGVALFSFHFIDEDCSVARLVVYVIGKMGISMSSGILYILASEIFPTYLRNSLIGFCSTLGRFGSVAAPQAPLIADELMDPVLLFGILALITTAFSLLLPETRNQPLPESIKETENLGKRTCLSDRRSGGRLITWMMEAHDPSTRLLANQMELHRKTYVIVSTPMWKAKDNMDSIHN